MKRSARLYWVVLGAAVFLFFALPLVFSAPFMAEFSFAFLVISLIFLYPVFFAVTGWLMGLMDGAKWFIPLISAAVFFVSAYFLYGMNEWFYTAQYLLLGYAGILLRLLLKRIRGNKSDTTGKE